MPIESFLTIVAPLSRVDTPATVDAFVSETLAILRDLVTHFEIILVDDGTMESPVDRVESLLAAHDFLRYLRLSRAFGEETAIAAGLDLAIGDYVIVMLPNMDPPALIPQFFHGARTDADIVYGVRTDRAGEPAWYRLGARAFYLYLNRVVGAALPEDSTQFRCLSRQVVNAITRIRDGNRYLRLLTSYVGFRKVALSYAPINRSGEPTVRPKGEALELARALVMDHTLHPLRLVCWGAVAVAVLECLLILVGSLIGRPIGWLGGQSAMHFLLVALALAVISEYVGGMLSRSRDRPSYYVRDEQTSSVLLKEERRNVVSGSDIET